MARAACAHEGCREPASVRARTAHGWANLCLHHYLAHHGAVARRWCEERGLNTQESQMEFCSPRLAKIYRERRNRWVEF